MNITKLITKKIKELYPGRDSKALFCIANGYTYKNFASKVKTIINQIDKVNAFLKPLNLVMEIKEIENVKSTN